MSIRYYVEINAVKNNNPASITLYDSKGVALYQEQFVRTQEIMTRQVDIDHFPRGYYIIAIDIDVNNRQMLKFVKQ